MKKTILVTIWTTVAVNFVLSLIDPLLFWTALWVFFWYRCGTRAKVISKEFIENELHDDYDVMRAHRILNDSVWWGLPMLTDACNVTGRCLLKEVLPSILYKAIPSFRSPFKN